MQCFSNPHDIHVWNATLTLSPERIANAYSTLSPVEKARADRFLVEPARQDYIASTFYLRRVLARYLHTPAESILLDYGKYGKPFITPISSIRFNLSHAGNQWLMAVAWDREVGIDIEYCQPNIQALELAQRFFAPVEYQTLLALEPAAQRHAFYKIWTLKEAFIKATGKGLSFGLDQFVVDWEKSGMQCLKSLSGCEDSAKSWSLGRLEPPSDEYAAALAVQGPIHYLLCLGPSPL